MNNNKEPFIDPKILEIIIITSIIAAAASFILGFFFKIWSYSWFTFLLVPIAVNGYRYQHPDKTGEEKENNDSEDKKS